ncbi:MAG: PH domain-containing protein [Limisphaerales bacterium]
MRHYKAPWSTSLIVATSVISVLLLGFAFGTAFYGRGIISWTGLLPLAILVCSIPFTIRGYTVTPGAILVHRLFWTTRLPLSGLESAKFEPEAMRGSIRTFGNGGLFSITGFFRNKALGAYRAFVTDQHQTVVLHYSGRTVVLSPSSPEEFVHDIGV